MTLLQSWNIPTTNSNESLHASLHSGQVLTLLGPNGAGKSALISWLSSQKTKTPVKRIFAHRRVWLSSSGPEITATTRKQYSDIISRQDQLPESRTKGDYEEQRVSGVLYDLLGKENGRNSRFVKLVEAEKPTEKIEDSLLSNISLLMRDVGIDLSFEITDHMSLDVLKGSARYPLSAMSDGEKAAFLLAAEILMAPNACTLLLDEPERHFHRSISPNLISALIEARSDCGFVISTHDIDLVESMKLGDNSVFFVNEVRWSIEGIATSWDIQEIRSGESINDSARRAVLGGRRKIMFIEGTSESLDLALMSTLYPDYYILPTGSSHEVQTAVKGLKSSTQFHWVSAKGIIDGDTRHTEESEQLRAKDILVLPVNEVESLYYLPQIIEAQAKRQESHFGLDSDSLFKVAQTAALESICQQNVSENLAAVNAVKILRRSALTFLPDKNDLKTMDEKINFELQSPYASELNELAEAIEKSDLETIVKKFSIRDSGFPTAVAKALRYGSKADYQNAVIVTINQDQELKQTLRKLIDGESPI